MWHAGQGQTYVVPDYLQENRLVPHRLPLNRLAALYIEAARAAPSETTVGIGLFAGSPDLIRLHAAMLQCNTGP